VTRRALAAALTAGTAGLLLAACSTGSVPAQQHGAVTSAPVTAPATAVPSAPSPVPGTSSPAATPTTSPAPRSSDSSTVSPAPVATPPAVPRLADPCPAAALTVRLLPGGAAQGIEYAAVSITNSGTAACNLRGYPAVVLRNASGGVLTTAGPLPGSTARVVRLAPGQEAQAQVQDHSTCQAPLSSSVAVAAPAPSAGAATTSTRPLNQLRACTVYVAPVGMAS
jgi:hypothetical protein